MSSVAVGVVSDFDGKLGSVIGGVVGSVESHLLPVTDKGSIDVGSDWTFCTVL